MRERTKMKKSIRKKPAVRRAHADPAVDRVFDAYPKPVKAKLLACIDAGLMPGRSSELP